MNRPGPATASPLRPAVAATDPRRDLKAALIRWGRLVHAVKSCEDLRVFTDLLAEASDAGMTLQEVMAALDDPR